MNLDPTPGAPARGAADSGRMGKLLGDNRVVGAVFVLLVVLNAMAMQFGWYT